MTHELKILPQYYKEVMNGNKTFEIRKNDRAYKVNDTILFLAWDGAYLNKPSFCRRISYVLEGCPEYGLMDGYVILGLDTPSAKPCESEWIPVSEKLPEDGTWNLFTDGNMVSVERYKADAMDHFYPIGRWFSLDEVIAWMPLPEPYKEGEEE